MSNQITMHLLCDHGRYYVEVVIVGPGVDHQADLASFDTAEAAGAYMSKWARDRDLVWASDSARRLSEAQRQDSPHLALSLVSPFDPGLR